MIIKLFASPNNTTMEDAQKFFKYDTLYVWVLVASAVLYSLLAYVIFIKGRLKQRENQLHFALLSR